MTEEEEQNVASALLVSMIGMVVLTWAFQGLGMERVSSTHILS